MKWRAAAVIPLVLILSGCNMALAGRASDEWTRTYQLSPGTTFEVWNWNGRVEIEGVDGSTVDVRAERIAMATTDAAARDLLPKIKINETVNRDRILVQTEKMPGLLIGAGVEVRYHIKAPKNAPITVQTTNGAVVLNGLSGRTDAVVTNGAITGERLGGALHAKATNGAIRIALASVGPEPIEISTTNGALRVAVPESAKANVSASCTNGGINVVGLKLDVQEQSKRRLEAKLNGGGPRVDLRTVNGGIRVTAAAGGATDTAEK